MQNARNNNNNDQQSLTKKEQRRRKKRLLLLLLLLFLSLLATGFFIGSLLSKYFGADHPAQEKLFQAPSTIVSKANLKPLVAPGLSLTKTAAVQQMPVVSSQVKKTAKSVEAAIAKPELSKPIKADDEILIPTSNAPPAGFEFLNEPIETIVDVYYAGGFLASVNATYTPTTIRFDNPDSFLSKISNLKNPQAVKQALTGEIATNSRLICPNQPGPNCGFLKPKVAGVIFDADKFKVELFISPELLKPGAAPNPFIPAPNTGFSFVSHLYGATNGITSAGNRNANAYGLRATNDLGYKQTVLHSQLSYSRDDFTDDDDNINSFHVDSLNLGHYFHSKYVARAGILDTQGSTFIGNETYMGASVGTTLDTLQQDSSAFGTRIQVFLSSPSYVSIYRDGRLLASRFYQAGNQVLDTSTLPSGAYQIAIRIRDTQGNVTSQTRFFSKTSQIPPLEFPQYYASVGYLEKNQFDQNTTLPQFAKTPVFQLGYDRRVKSNWGFNSSVVGTNHVALSSAGVFFLGDGYQVNPQFLYGTDKENGIGLNLQTNLNNFNATMFARQIWAHNKSPVNEPVSFFDPEDISFVDILTAEQDSTQADLSMGYDFNKVYASINAHISKFANLPTIYSYGPDLRIPLLNNNGTNLDLHLNAARTRDDWQVMVQFTVYFTSSHWVNSTTAGYQSFNDSTGSNSQLEENSGFVGDTTLNWQNLNAAQEGTVLGVNGHVEPGRSSVGVDGQYTAPLGGVEANAQRNMGSRVTANTQYSANFTTHVAYADHHTAVGGGRYSENTGVIIDVESPESGDEFEVYVNDQIYQIVKTNSPTPVFLTPFKTYKIRIKSVGKRLYEYSQSPKTVTLYRGNFKSLEWQTRQKAILFGYVKTPSGEALKNTLIRGGVGINATDEDGSAQIELYDDTKQLTATLLNHQPCVIKVPTLKHNGSLTVDKNLICEPENVKK
jgi:hypothetical protein